MSAPAQLATLKQRLAEISDLQALASLMFWDQNTMMPPGGAEPRGEMAATLQRVLHARETDPELPQLLDALEPWADGEDPDSDDARLILESYWRWGDDAIARLAGDYAFAIWDAKRRRVSFSTGRINVFRFFSTPDWGGAGKFGTFGGGATRF